MSKTGSAWPSVSVEYPHPLPGPAFELGHSLCSYIAQPLPQSTPLFPFPLPEGQNKPEEELEIIVSVHPITLRKLEGLDKVRKGETASVMQRK